MNREPEQKYFLSLMRMPGDYTYIDISTLDISNNYKASSLEAIDTFTLNHTIDEIKESVKRANVVSSEYLNGKLVIADNLGHNPIKVLDKEYYNNFRIDSYLESIINDKVKVNNLINKFNSICKDDLLKGMYADALKNKRIDIALNVIFSMSYISERRYIIYIIDGLNKETNKNKQLKRDKIAY